MAGAALGYGVQVVSINEDKFQFNEEALQQILLRDDVKDRPVVVISIAGAYRGGKSFMLSFFLRYLEASAASRNNGSWLGANNAPLRGFEWRGGMERHTTGIIMWSEPIPATLPSGEKVAILLMDTQGSFDSLSTVRENSSIFAISTLLSSLQIYNLSQNIKEDDLNNLELFTEFGKMMQNTNEVPFQALQFLVRDWCNPYEYEYGSNGGQQFLERKLTIRDNMPTELRDIRRALKSSFENINCFLMPHPGFAVTSIDFRGCIEDLREEFKASLLEFVPSVLDPTNLRTKTINGQTVKACDFITYFKCYMNLLNSSEVPQPMSTFQATSTANRIIATRAACEAYEAKMERVCGRSVLPEKLREIHRATVLDALAVYRRRAVTHNHETEEDLNNLQTELDGRLAMYTAVNEAKIREAFTTAKSTYNDYLAKIFDIYHVCMHPTDLEDVHNKAVAAAIDIFNSKLNVFDNETWDKEINDLKMHLAGQINQLRSLNRQNNQAALAHARNLYHSTIEKILRGGSCVSDRFLERKHDETVNKVFKEYRSKRQRIRHDLPNDEYQKELTEYFKEHYTKLEHMNRNNYKTLVQTIVHTYNDTMASVCSGKCLHPEELGKEHTSAVHQALKEFNTSRLCDEDDDVNDEDTDKLITTLEKRRNELNESNDKANKNAVAAAYNEYCRLMNRSSAPSITSIFILPLVVKIAALPAQHRRAKEEAMKIFWRKRRTNNTYSSDRHLDSLKEMLSDGYESYCNPGRAVAREVGIPIDND